MATAPHNTADRAAALADLEARKQQFLTPEFIRHRVRNADLPAGSPMHYYCRVCGAEYLMPELFEGPSPKLCDDCADLRDLGWITFPKPQPQA